MQEDKQDLKNEHEDGDSREEKTETIEALQEKPEMLISIKEKEDLQTTEKENVGVVETTKAKQQEEKLDNKEATKDWAMGLFWAQNGIFDLFHQSIFFVAPVYVAAILWWKFFSLLVRDDSERRKHFLKFTGMI